MDGAPWEERLQSREACATWADRRGSGQLRGLTSTGWAGSHGSFLFSRAQSYLSDPTQDPASISLHGSLRPKPAQTCPGLATGPAGPSGGEGGREKMQSCCTRGTFGACRPRPAAESGPHHPPAPPFPFLPMTSCGCLPDFLFPPVAAFWVGCPHSPAWPAETPLFSHCSPVARPSSPGPAWGAAGW